MNRTLGYGLLAVSIAVLLAAWFLNTFERVEVEERVRPSAEARRNPFLAAERFVQRMGRETREFAGVPGHVLPPAGATLVLPGGSAMISPPQANALLDWVAAGGHLVVEPDAEPGSDALLGPLGVQARRAEPSGKPEPFAVTLPSAAAPLKIAPFGRTVLDPGSVQPELSAGDALGVRLLHLRRGSGHVTVLTGTPRFYNRRIGEHDHAAFLWAVLGLAPNRGPVLWVQAPDAPSLGRWLLEHAGAVVAATLASIALWLWHVVPRFGPTRPPPVAGSRALVQHLTAAGRFRWAHGGRASLLLAARAICLKRVAAAHPRIALLPPADRDRELAALAGVTPAEVSAAFGGSPRSPHELVATLNVLSRIHDGLRHPGRSLRPRKARS